MNFLGVIRSAEPGLRRSLTFFLLSYFCVLFNYPLVRASSTTLFFEAFGAKSTPTAWLWGVLFLSLTVYTSNKLQATFSVQKVFLLVSLASVVIFILGTAGYLSGLKFFTFLPFVWKEIYIVLQIHLLLAYFNNCFKKDEFKLLVGIVGGVGSVGGILGGWLTSFLADSVGTLAVMWIGLLFVILPGIFFLGTSSFHKEREMDKGHPGTPLQSLTPGIGRYVAIIAGIVALSQFIINIADFNFHLAFEKSISELGARTSYLGNIYMLTNLVTFVLQFLVLPVILTRVSEKRYHLAIPVTYLLCLLPLMLISGPGILAYAAFFVYLKGSDYSLFSAGKEILYQPLSPHQKYGAKYLTDMLVYRIAKALIAAVLIYLQTSTILNTLMIIFLFAWIMLISMLFKLHRQLFS